MPSTSITSPAKTVAPQPGVSQASSALDMLPLELWTDHILPHAVEDDFLSSFKLTSRAAFRLTGETLRRVLTARMAPALHAFDLKRVEQSARSGFCQPPTPVFDSWVTTKAEAFVSRLHRGGGESQVEVLEMALEKASESVAELNTVEEIRTLFARDDAKDIKLDEMGLIRVPTRVFELQALTQLSLVGNDLSELSPAFFRLKNLSRLQLSSNTFSCFPEPLASFFPALVHLDVSDNLFGDEERTQRTRQDVAKETALTFKNMTTLISLAHLNLANNELPFFPPLFAPMKKLRSLDIRGNPFQYQANSALTQGLASLSRHSRISLEVEHIARLEEPIGALAEATGLSPETEWGESP